MRRPDAHDVERLLRRRPDPRPPARLAQMIKDEIPARIVVGEGALRHDVDREHALVYRQLVVLGALLLLAVAVALWGLRAILGERERTERQNEIARLLAVGAGAHLVPGGWVDADMQPDAVLPLRVDTAPYTSSRSQVMAGRLPPPESVSAAAFVSALDYGDPAPLAGELAIFAEGAVGPADGAPTRRLVRIALHTAPAPPSARIGVPPPVAIGATARLAVDREAVSRYRLIGGSLEPGPAGDSAPGEDLPAGHRVTFLLELELRPGVAADGELLTISAAWRRRSGAAAALAHTVTARDTATPWTAAPLSLRVAARAAELANALTRRPGPDPATLDSLRRQAAALAAGHPTYPGIAELARFCAALRDPR